MSVALLVTPDESKSVGWDGDMLNNFPEPQFIERVIANRDRHMAITIYRYAPEPGGGKRMALDELIAFLAETCPDSGEPPAQLSEADAATNLQSLLGALNSEGPDKPD